ncbi:hypothetical protein K458DRAFT_383625 [Lentithecium fluviatile CBS 122367]|uniref:Uncharacterized protein n=1 Tax=Lentithecium fluviatile CBS 122367 TaxID=1168545 RepID=A0A6G1JJ66_9PLEO|nr:hypothetical protein K458DRAFT_383625 [Lentithecium fluviatile CBS 122367]
MTGPEGLHRGESRYQQGFAPEQNPRYQMQHESAPTGLDTAHNAHYQNVPQVSNFSFASIDEMVHQMFPPPQMQSNTTSNKRRRISTDHGFRPLLPKSVDGMMPNFTNDQYTLTTTIHDGAQQHTLYPQSTSMNDTFASNHNSGFAHQEYTSPPQHNVVPTHPQLYPSPKSYVQLGSQPPTNRWTQAREYRRKVQEPPQVDPRDDPTIADVEQNAEFWIAQLITAMTNTTDVKDTDSSHARRMFLPEGNLPALLIEATCREIFTALLDRCKHGFRGPATFNKALKPHKDSEPDKTALCRERMESVVEVLHCNKRVCKDVLYEDWKIRLFVNHPLAYDKEKDCQKGSNDQRRLRLERERERLRQTEDELKAYREAGQLDAVREVGMMGFRDEIGGQGEGG